MKENRIIYEEGDLAVVEIVGGLEIAFSLKKDEVIKFAETVLSEIGEAFDLSFAQIARIWGEAYKSINELFTNINNIDRELFAVCDNPKHWHLYKHAKKYRVRKKYYNRFMRQLEKLSEANAQET